MERTRLRGICCGIAALCAIVTAGMMVSPVVNAAEVSWTTPVTIGQGTYNSLNLEVTKNAIYMLSWEYGTNAYGSTYLFKSVDGGTSWTRTDVFGGPIADGHPGFTAYTTSEGNDVIIVASAPGLLAKSVDGGSSFSVSTLPLGAGVDHWMYLTVGVNASTSWLGAVEDPDVYVVGSQVMDWYWSGELYISLTVSHDGGGTWCTPTVISPTLGSYPLIVREGSNLDVVYMSLAPDVTSCSLMAIRSSDWGRTWTAPEEIYARTYTDGGVDACGLQNLGNGQAALTASDHRPIYTDNYGIWGLYSFDDMSFAKLGSVMGDGWNSDIGFAGTVLGDGRLALGYLYYDYTIGKTAVIFTYGKDTGLPAPQLENPIALIQALKEDVSSANIAPRVRTPLLATLTAAENQLTMGHEEAAVRSMGAFINELTAQKDKRVDVAHSVLWTSAANHIISLIGA